VEPRNESSSFGKKDLQELQSRAASRHCLHYLFLGCAPQAAPGLTPKMASELKVKEFSNILTRLFLTARVEK
jgi:hypothetical protein